MGAPNAIARTGADILYRKGTLALALLDFDTKGMPADVVATLRRHGGYWPALLAVLPDLQTVARVTRRSTSAGLFRADTGHTLPGSDGVHIYVAVQDGTDIERFLKTLHDALWLAGIGDDGRRRRATLGSIDRRSHGGGAGEAGIRGRRRSSCRRCAQDRRRGGRVQRRRWLDTLAACPPLTIAETARLTS